MTLRPTLDIDSPLPVRRRASAEDVAEYQRAEAARIAAERERTRLAKRVHPPQVIEAARVLGMRPDEIRDVTVTPEGLIIEGTTGQPLILVPEDRPDAAGNFGLMLLEPSRSPKVNERWQGRIYTRSAPAATDEHNADDPPVDPLDALDLNPGQREGWTKNAPEFLAVCADVFAADEECRNVDAVIADMVDNAGVYGPHGAAGLTGALGELRQRRDLARSRAFDKWRAEHPAPPDPNMVARFAAVAEWAAAVLDAPPGHAIDVDRRLRDRLGRWLPNVSPLDQVTIRREGDQARAWLDRHGIEAPS